MRRSAYQSRERLAHVRQHFLMRVSSSGFVFCISFSIFSYSCAALAKRPHDNWTSSGSGGCGVGSEQKRRSREADSPLSSTVSDKKKLVSNVFMPFFMCSNYGL